VLRPDGRHPSVAAVVILAAFASGCRAQPSPGPMPSPTVEAPTPTPEVRVRVTRSSFLDGPPRVLGFLELDAGPDSSEAVLEVALVDPTGQVAARVQAPSLTPLVDSAEAFFASDLPALWPAGSLKVEIVSRRPALAGLQPLEATIVSSTWLGGGVRSLLGRLEHSSPQTLTPLSAIVVGVDESRDPVAYAEAQVVLDRIGPGEGAPFRADVPQADNVADWEFLGYGLPAQPGGPPAVSLEGEVSLFEDPQGSPFAVGQLVNPAPEPRRVRVGILIEEDDAWVALGIFETPSVLPAEATMPFAIDHFPSPEDLATIASRAEVHTYLVEEASGATVHPLQADLNGFEVVGSRLYLRGTLSNHGAARVTDATVVAGVLRVTGELLTAGWGHQREPIEPGGQASFLIVLPIPEGTDLSLAEYDIRGFGLEG
jgi:hypothetical protein